MKKSSRKRLLVSSVAMLLVAMLSLGTATYAWFTTDTSTKADGINVSTVKASNLKISRWDHNWVDGFSYGHANDSYKPASSTNGTDWFTATAAKKDEMARTGDFTALDAPATTNDHSKTGIANYLFMEELNIKNEGAATAKEVKIEVTGTFSDYVRVAFVESNESHVMSGTFGTNVDGVSALMAKDATAYAPAKSTSAESESNLTPSTARTITVGDMAQNATKFYRVFVWFEGQDDNCVDLNAGQGLPDLSFKITAKN